MARLHGRNGLVYLQGLDANQAEKVSQAADWTLAIDHDVVDVGVMGDDWAYKLRGVNKWSGEVSGTWDSGTKMYWDASQANTARKFYLYPDKTTPGAYYYGTVWPKLNLKGGIGSAITFTMALDGDGALTPSA